VLTLSVLSWDLAGWEPLAENDTVDASSALQIIANIYAETLYTASCGPFSTAVVAKVCQMSVLVSGVC
jgi:hypothetical protein